MMTIAPTTDRAADASPSDRPARRRWRGHLVNLRLPVPFPGRRFYLTILAGPERRCAERRRLERRRHPLRTVGNVLFVALACLALYAAAAIGLLLYSSVLTL